MPFLAEEHLPIPDEDILSWIFDHVSYDWDMPIYIDAANPARTISARQALDTIGRLITGLKAAGVQQGDCICYPLAFLGIIGAGGIFAGTNPSYTTHELTHAIRTASIKHIIVEPPLLPAVLSAARSCSIPDAHVILFDPAASPPSPPSPHPTYRTLLAHPPSPWLRLSPATTPAARLFSSGTTGAPKALDLTHAHLIAQHTLTTAHPTHHKPYAVRRLLCTPFFHVSQVARAHVSALRGGFAAVVQRRFEARAWVAAVAAHGVTEANVVPGMVGAVVALGEGDRAGVRAALGGLRNVWCGAAPMGAALQARLATLLPAGTPCTQAWGMSETSGIASFLYWPEADATGSVGRMLPGVDVKLVDDGGNDVSDYNISGELCIRGPIIVAGYYRNEEANKRDWDEDGYFHTGDVAYCDRESKLWYIVDRKKELIKVRGFQVSPTEVESVLLSHPNIADAGVIGVTLAENESELPRAYVVQKPGTKVTEQEVMEYVTSRLSRYKRPEGGIRIVESIPKNASGKILKKELREQAKRELAAKL
ncbi:4-coumarate-CoA ligase-like protein [Neofusicoccum parvum]|nr:4-coumarate-CoA ligase-like protein [Neofusicoccum parvum]